MKTLKSTSMAFIILGSVHLIATPMAIQDFKQMGRDPFITFLYMFIVTGLSMVFIGWIQFQLTKAKTLNKTLIHILKGSIIFMMLIGAFAVGLMWTNPFAYIALIIALIQAFYLFTAYKKQVFENFD